MKMSRIAQIAYFLLRVVAGGMFLQHGAQKLLGWFGGPGPAGLPTQMVVGAVIELSGGILILLGLLTRPAAFILSGEMAVAYWQFHAPQALWPVVNKGELAVLYCFVFLFMAAQGGGDWSLDALIWRRRADADAKPV